MAMQPTESVNTALGGVSPPSVITPSGDGYRTTGESCGLHTSWSGYRTLRFTGCNIYCSHRNRLRNRLIRQSGWLGANPSPVIASCGDRHRTHYGAP
jgi:hypothetical protein